MKRRWRFARKHLGCGWFDAAFMVFLNEMSNLPANKIGFMHILWDMNDYPDHTNQ